MEILLMIAVFSAVSFFAVKKYRELESIMDAKKIHEKLKQQKFWEQQQSFDE